MGLLTLFGLFAFGLLIGAPVTFTFEGLPLQIAFQRIVSGVPVFSLPAIPFFIFAGEPMLHGASRRGWCGSRRRRSGRS